MDPIQPAQTLDVLGLYGNVIIQNHCPNVVETRLIDDGEGTPIVEAHMIHEGCHKRVAKQISSTQTVQGLLGSVVVKNFAGCVCTLELADDGINTPVVHIRTKTVDCPAQQLIQLKQGKNS